MNESTNRPSNIFCIARSTTRNLNQQTQRIDLDGAHDTKLLGIAVLNPAYKAARSGALTWTRFITAGISFRNTDCSDLFPVKCSVFRNVGAMTLFAHWANTP